MNYTFVKDLISSAWMIEATTLNSLYPIFKGLFSGLRIDAGSEPKTQKPYAIKASDKSVILSYYDEEDEDGNKIEKPNVKVINVLPIRSVIMKHDQPCGPVGTRTLKNRLLNADADENVIGHILVIESGGGQAMAIAELTEAIEKCTKPVIAWIDGMSASAAYYISCYAKEIIASREFDMIGCIGTLVVYEGRTAKSEPNMLGEVSVTIYADGSDEKNQEYEKAINEFDFKLAKERILNPFNEKFISDVKSKRPQVLQEQLKGRTYFAKDIVGSLVDSIGSFETAVDRVLALADFKNEPQGGNNNQTNSKREMKQFTQLNSALNVESLESAEEGIYLQEAQLEIIEERLEANQQLATERDGAIQERDTIQASLTTAQADLAKAYDPLNAIDPTIAAANTADEKATAIRNLLSKQPGTTPVGTLGKKDDTLESSDVDWDTINGLEHNKELDKNI